MLEAAALVEGGGTLRRHPHLLDAAVCGPRLQPCHERLPNTLAAPVRPHDRADYPRRAVTPLVEVELVHAYTAQHRAIVTNGHKGDGHALATHRLLCVV